MIGASTLVALITTLSEVGEGLGAALLLNLSYLKNHKSDQRVASSSPLILDCRVKIPGPTFLACLSEKEQ